MARITQAGAIVVDGDRVLIVRAKRSPHNWIFPKGHVERGESLADTACRELAEEAGVVGEAIEAVGISTFTRGKDDLEVTYYLMRFIGTTKPAERRETRWCSLDEARTLIAFADARRLLDRVEALLAGE